MSVRRPTIILFLVLLLGGILRFLWLDKIPNGMTNDNVGTYYTSKILWNTGRSLNGTFLPLAFTADNSFASGYIYFFAPFVGLLPKSPLAIRLPSVVVSLFSICLLYFIIKELTQKESSALAAAFVLSVSPWHIFMNRNAYDGPISFSLLLFFYIFLKRVKRGIAVTLPFLFFSFYVYHATKIFLIAFVPLLLFVYRKELLKRKLDVIVFIIGCIGILASFYFVIRYQGVTRSEILLTNSVSSSAAITVNWERAKNTAPMILRQIFSNKLSYFGYEIMNRYLGAFSPYLLFFNGEGGIYGTYRHGLFYLIEFPLLLIGLSALLYRYGKKTQWLILGGLLFAPLPSSVASDISYALRSIALLPFIAAIIGLGLAEVIAVLSKSKRRKVIGFVAIVCLYAFSISAYCYVYFFRFPITGAETYFKSNKDLISYLNSQTNAASHIVIADPGPMFVFQYGFYTSATENQILTAWKQPWPKVIGNLTLEESCRKKGNDPLDLSDLPVGSFYVSPASCYKNSTPSSDIRNFVEPLELVWKIYKR